MPSPYAAVPLADTQAVSINGVTCHVQCQPAPDSFIRYGQVLRAEHRAGGACCRSVDDPSAPEKKRNEIAFPSFAAGGGKQWLAAQVMVEPGPVIAPPNALILMQQHLDVALGTTSPGLALYTRSFTGQQGEVIGFCDESGTHTAWVPLVRGHVYRAVLAITESYGESTGTVEGWLDGDVPVVVWTGMSEVAQGPGNLLSRV